MTERYPGYDVLAKRDSPSWNEPTRRVIDERMALNAEQHQFFTDAEWRTVCAVCARIVPQPRDRASPAPVAALLDEKLQRNSGDGYRDTRLPPMRAAWRRALLALDAEAHSCRGCRFDEMSVTQQDALLTSVQQGRARDPAWGNMPGEVFFTKRLLHDVVSAYYAHPASWNEIGFGGPAGPRGYVRMNFDRRDPWEAAEGKPGQEEKTRRENSGVG